jgi:internalin A
MRRTRVMFTALVPLLLAVGEVHADEAEDRAVEAVKMVRGKLTRDENAAGNPVIAVDFVGGRVRDEELKELVPHLATFKKLQKLSLPFLVTDAGIKELAPLSQLRTLELLGCQVTDAGLKELAPLAQLQTLMLKRTDITDAGLKELAVLQNLRDLDVSITAVTDAGLKHLAPLTHLHRLDLSGNRAITDAGMKELPHLKELDTLWLYGTRVGDSGMKEVGRLEKLQTLRLFNTNVGDEGLKELVELKQLRRLELGTKVTETGVAELQRALPGCEITWQTRRTDRPVNE